MSLKLFLVLVNIFIFFDEFNNPVQCFNIDTDYPIVIANPENNQSKSLFGYSVVMYNDGKGQKWLKIGAPKATCDRFGKKTLRSGIIYHCPYKQQCEIDENLNYTSNFIFDQLADLNNSWIGGSLDISPTLKTVAISASNWNYFDKKNPLFRGGYFLENLDKNVTFRDSPLKKNLLFKTNDNLPYPFQSRAKLGFSVHFAKDYNELLLGAPGVYNYLGSVIKANNINEDQSKWTYEVVHPRGNYDEYFGYSLTSGYFYKNNQFFYVSGLPRGHNSDKKELKGILFGAVVTFTFLNEVKEKFENHYEAKRKEIIYGTQVGEYFGSSLSAGDLNGDHVDDLIVGAPFRKNERDGYNHGSVYVFYGNKKKLEPTRKRIDAKKNNGQFGTALMYLKDLDDDGYGEIAISAPYEEHSGVVYIYSYDRASKELRISQKIPGKNVFSKIRGFGMSFSRPTDIDDNKVNDLAVGAPLSGHVIILRSKPVVILHPRVGELPSSFNKTDNSFKFLTCCTYKSYEETSLDVKRTIDIDSDHKRFFFNNNNKPVLEDSITVYKTNESCQWIYVHKNTTSTVRNTKDPISITVTYTIPNEKESQPVKSNFILNNNTELQNDEFCEKCPILGKKSFRSKTWYVIWNQLCDKRPCLSKLEVTGTFDNLNNDTFILGSADFVTLKVIVTNKGDPAYSPSLKIHLPNGVTLREGPGNCGNEEINNCIFCDIGEYLIDEVNYIFEFNMESINEELELNEISFFLNTSTVSDNLLGPGRANLTLFLVKEANFLITGESKESTYTYIEQSSTVVQNIFKVEKIGPSAIAHVEAEIQIPYKISDSKGNFYQFANIEYKNITSMDQQLKCYNKTNFNNDSKKTTRKAMAPGLLENAKNKSNSNVNSVNAFNINCDISNVECILLKCDLGPFNKMQSYYEIFVEMAINFSKIEEDILTSKDSIYITTNALINTDFSQEENRSNFSHLTNLLVIDRNYKISFWIIIGSAVSGLLILIFISICLLKAGFFERKTHKKLIELKEQVLEEERLIQEMIDKEQIELDYPSFEETQELTEEE